MRFLILVNKFLAIEICRWYKIFLIHIWFIATFGYIFSVKIAIFWVHLHMDDRHLSYVKKIPEKMNPRARPQPLLSPPQAPNTAGPFIGWPGSSRHKVTGYRGHRRRRSQTSGRMELTWWGRGRRTVGLRLRIGRTSLFSHKLQVSNFPPRERSKKWKKKSTFTCNKIMFVNFKKIISDKLQHFFFSLLGINFQGLAHFAR